MPNKTQDQPDRTSIISWLVQHILYIPLIRTKHRLRGCPVKEGAPEWSAAYLWRTIWERDICFATLKAEVGEPRVFALLRSWGDNTVDTDTCHTQIAGIVLPKLLYGTDRPIQYCSCSLDEPERVYDRTHGKRLPEVWAVFVLWLYLEHCRRTICTDHADLKWAYNISDLIRTFGRHSQQTAEVKLDVILCVRMKH